MSTDRALYLRENAGVVQSLDNRAFNPTYVDAVFNEANIEVDKNTPKEVFVCIDTAGGGQSCTAVCTGFYTNRQMVVLGAESLVLASDAELEKALETHLKNVRAVVGIQATFITIIEQNYGGWVYASRVAALCDRFQPCLHLTRDSTPLRRIGVVTTHEVKETMRFVLQDKLRGERFAFAEPFVTSTNDVKEELKKQLKAYKFIEKNSEVQARRYLTGKVNGMNDDLCIAVQMLSFWPTYYFQNERCARTFVL